MCKENIRHFPSDRQAKTSLEIWVEIFFGETVYDFSNTFSNVEQISFCFNIEFLWRPHKKCFIKIELPQLVNAWVHTFFKCYYWNEHNLSSSALTKNCIHSLIHFMTNQQFIKKWTHVFIQSHSLAYKFVFLILSLSPSPSNGHRQREKETNKGRHALKIGGAHEKESNLKLLTHLCTRRPHNHAHYSLSNTHTHTHTHTHAHIHTRTHSHTNTHKLSLVWSPWVTSGRMLKWSMCVSVQEWRTQTQGALTWTYWT